jgi:hypothetical protein
MRMPLTNSRKGLWIRRAATQVIPLNFLSLWERIEERAFPKV